MLGLVLRACLALNIREPLEFFDLSEQAQELWLEHARNEFSGAYLHGPGATKGPGDFKARAVAAARERGVL